MRVDWTNVQWYGQRMDKTASEERAVSDGIPEAIHRYAATQRQGDKVLDCWTLHSKGGLNAPRAAKQLGVHPETARRWIRKCRALVKGNDGQRMVKALERGLSAGDVIAKRASLLAEAERKGKLELQQKLLSDEQRRLGLDVSRVEQVSLVVQVSSMSPIERSSEIMERLQRLAHRGMLPKAEVEQLTRDTQASPGAPPRPHPHARSQAPSWKSPPKNPGSARKELGTDGAHGFPAPEPRGIDGVPSYIEEEEGVRAGEGFRVGGNASIRVDAVDRGEGDDHLEAGQQVRGEVAQGEAPEQGDEQESSVEAPASDRALQAGGE